MSRKVPAVIITLLLLFTAMLLSPAGIGNATVTGFPQNKQLISVSKRLQVAASVYLNSLRPPVHSLRPASGLAREVVGYYVADWAGDRASLVSLQAYGTRLSGVAVFAYQLKADGTLHGQASPEAMAGISRSGGKAIALIHNCINGSFDRNIAHAVLANQAARTAAMANIAAMVRDNGFAGVNIDLENIPATDRTVFSRFVADLSRTLHEKGYLVTISVPAKTSDTATGWGGAFDYKTIGRHVDRVMLMTYDEHWIGGPAGPVASIGWVENVIRYATSQIPADKLLLGVGMYGYDWNVSTGKGTSALSSVNALRKAAQTGAAIYWDNAAQTPYYYYYANGAKHVVWFESNASAAFKLNLVNRYNLAGVAVWRLGYEDAGFWQLIDRKFARSK